jgi:hypothetical protein
VAGVMTDDQFAALAELLRLRQSASGEAARLVLVEGLSVGDAAACVGISSPAASKLPARPRTGSASRWDAVAAPSTQPPLSAIGAREGLYQQAFPNTRKCLPPRTLSTLLLRALHSVRIFRLFPLA